MSGEVESREKISGNVSTPNEIKSDGAHFAASSVKKGVIPDGYQTISEGSASILFETGSSDVFYNEVQVKNRDLSVLVLNEFSMQLEHEARDQVELRRAGKSWRNIPPTWTTWGRQTTGTSKETPAEAIALKEAVNQENEDNLPKEKLESRIEKICRKYDDVQCEGLRILEALAASGLRSIRYANEIVEGVGVQQITVNDLEEAAFENMKRNFAFNGFNESDGKLKALNADAVDVMYQHRIEPVAAAQLSEKTRVLGFLDSKAMSNEEKRPFDVIDLDPYGSPTIFVDSAVQGVREGGLLCITATDLSTLVGKNADNCYAKYRAMPLKLAPYGHEMAIRILLSYIDSVASKYDRYIVPLMSTHIDFYIRVFIRVYSSKAEVKAAALRSSMVFHSKCGDGFWLQPLGQVPNSKNDDESMNQETLRPCSVKPAVSKIPQVCTESGAALAVGGPIWNGPIHNKKFVNSLLNRFRQPCPNGFDALELRSVEQTHGLIDAVYSELEVPLYYHLPALARVIHVSTPGLVQFQSALFHAGYKVSQAHSNPQAVKTDAPPHVVWDIMRAWFQRNPGKRIIDDEHVKTLLNKKPTIDVDFTIAPQIRKMMKRNLLVPRYKKNPKKNWGPKPAACGKASRQTHLRTGKRHGEFREYTTDSNAKEEKKPKTGKMHLFDL